jgi:hypothetical protein
MRSNSVGQPALGREGDGTKRPSGSTEAYFRTDGVHTGPVLVLYHIQKTAGTSLRRLVRANLPPAQLEVGADLQKLRYRREELLRWHREWYASLGEERRARLCCVMSHSAGFLLPALDRPVEALVLVREPVDRVLSFYFYKRRRPGDPPSGNKREFPRLEDIYSTTEEERARLRKPARLESWEQFSNWQSRALLSVFHDVAALLFSPEPPRDADLWRDRLRALVAEVYTVGPQDRLAAFVDRLARRHGWQVTAIPKSKANVHRSDEEVTPALRETILAHNWLDVELYELAREAQAEREVSEPGPR